MLVAAQAADGDGAFLGLALADDQQERDLGQAVLAHLVVDLLVAEVGLGADARPPAAWPTTSLRIVVGVGDDRRDHRLHRRQPQRELAGVMLDQDADEALERAEDRAVEHDRAVPLAVLADVGRVEPLGQHAVGLDRADLPGAADRVGQVEFELGRVEGALAGQLLPADIRPWRGPAATTASRSSASAWSHISSLPKRLSGRSASLIA